MEHIELHGEKYKIFPEKETTREGLDLLIDLGKEILAPGCDIGSYAAAGAYRIKKCIIGPKRMVIGALLSPLTDTFMVGNPSDKVIRTTNSLCQKLVQRALAPTSEEAMKLIETIESSWSTRAGNGSIDFQSGYLKLEPLEERDNHRFTHITYCDSVPFDY